MSTNDFREQSLPRPEQRWSVDVRERQVRAAEHQALFREVNERIDTLQRPSLAASRIDFVCECADDACSLPLTMSRSDYAALRSDAVCFAVLPHHVDHHVEEVVAEHDGYWLVRKLEAGAAVARSTDPRRRRGGAAA